MNIQRFINESSGLALIGRRHLSIGNVYLVNSLVDRFFQAVSTERPAISQLITAEHGTRENPGNRSLVEERRAIVFSVFPRTRHSAIGSVKGYIFVCPKQGANDPYSLCSSTSISAHSA